MNDIRVTLSYIDEFNIEWKIFHNVSTYTVKHSPDIIKKIVEICEKDLYQRKADLSERKEEEYTPMPIVPCC